MSPECPITEDEINGVARQLWCPLCSGVRLDACELKACDQMKVVIGQKLSAGEDVQSIKNYFLAQYGPQVLGEPPLEGFNWLAWLLPVAVLIGGGVFLWSRTRSMVRKPGMRVRRVRSLPMVSTLPSCSWRAWRSPTARQAAT